VEANNSCCPACGWAEGKPNSPIFLILLIVIGVPALLFGGCTFVVGVMSMWATDGVARGIAPALILIGTLAIALFVLFLYLFRKARRRKL
jgi:hypothetical protein